METDNKSYLNPYRRKPQTWAEFKSRHPWQVWDGGVVVGRWSNELLAKAQVQRLVGGRKVEWRNTVEGVRLASGMPVIRLWKGRGQ